MNTPTLATKEKNICLSLNTDRKVPKQRTVVVLGVERGGTSMTAGVVRGLGVSMGPRAGLNHEDPLFLTEETDRLKNRIAMRNNENDLWGFKVPKSSLMLDFYEKHLRNPYYIITYRNSLAVADSWVQRGAGTILDVLERSRAYHDALHTHARKTKNPILFLNYERAVQNEDSKYQTAREISTFLGLEEDPAALERAVSMVTGDGKGYVNLPEHFFLVSTTGDAPRGANIPLEQFGLENWQPNDKVTHDTQKPQAKFRLAGDTQQNLPKKLWLKLTFKAGKNVELAENPVRIFFNYTGEYFAGHCARPQLVNGENWLLVETSGNAEDFAFGTISAPSSFNLNAEMFAAT